MGLKKTVVFCFVLVLSFTMFSVKVFEVVRAKPETLVVPDDYSTIQDAVDNAVEGDTVYVKSGTYYEELVIDKQLFLVGEDRNSTIINEADYYSFPVRITCNLVEFSGFTVCSNHTAIGLTNAAYCNISGNIITNSESGIVIVSSSFNTVSGNIIEDVSGSAIHLSYATNNTIHGNHIVSTGGGIDVIHNSDYNNISENNIAKVSGAAISLAGAHGNKIVANNLTDSGYGVALAAANTTVFHLNNFINNTEQVLANAEPAPDGGIMFSVCTWINNYWSDYDGTDADGDGIGDTPYIINDYNQDDSPLMYIIPEFTSWAILTLLLATILATVLVKRQLSKTPHDT
jgi:parallel beta-helix repeat protein